MSKPSALVLALAFLCLAVIPLHATNIVSNPGFETGSLSGWTSIGSSGWLVSAATTDSGTYSARTPCGGSGCISNPNAGLYQDLPTVNGQSYAFSFWYTNTGGSPNELQVLWGGVVVDDLINQPGDAVWRQVILNETATSTTTRIQFNGRNDPVSVFIDDVSVAANGAGVPEPSTLALTGLGALLAGLYRKRRKI